MELIQVSKVSCLEDFERKVRPNNWETAFSLQVHLEDVDGNAVLVNMNFFCFIMNPKWRLDPIVNFVALWITQARAIFLGIIRRNDVSYPAPEEPVPGARPAKEPQPRSPWGGDKQADSGSSSEEEPQTKEVLERKDKAEERRVMKMLERRVNTPGVTIEDVTENCPSSSSTEPAATPDSGAGSDADPEGNGKRRRMQ